MSVGCFLDKNHMPSPEDVQAALGAQYGLWIKLLSFMEVNYQIPIDFSYGGKKYGWNLWYRKGGKSLASLYPQDQHFIAQVVLGKAEVEKAMQLDLGEKVGGLLKETPSLHDGKWLFIPVRAETDEQDVEQLILVKRRPIRQPSHADNRS